MCSPRAEPRLCWWMLQWSAWRTQGRSGECHCTVSSLRPCSGGARFCSLVPCHLSALSTQETRGDSVQSTFRQHMRGRVFCSPVLISIWLVTVCVPNKIIQSIIELLLELGQAPSTWLLQTCHQVAVSVWMGGKSPPLFGSVVTGMVKWRCQPQIFNSFEFLTKKFAGRVIVQFISVLKCFQQLSFFFFTPKWLYATRQISVCAVM